MAVEPSGSGMTRSPSVTHPTRTAPAGSTCGAGPGGHQAIAAARHMIAAADTAASRPRRRAVACAIRSASLATREAARGSASKASRSHRPEVREDCQPCRASSSAARRMRARDTRILTAERERPRAAAESAIDNPPTATSRTASRSREDSRARADRTRAASSCAMTSASGDGAPLRAPDASSSGAHNLRRHAARPARRRAMAKTNASAESGAPPLRHARTSAARLSCATSSASAGSPSLAFAYRSTRGASSPMVLSRSTITEEPGSLIRSHLSVRSRRRVG